MANISEAEYARLRLKAKHGTLTAEEQAALFERMASQSDAGSDIPVARPMARPARRRSSVTPFVLRVCSWAVVMAGTALFVVWGWPEIVSFLNTSGEQYDLLSLAGVGIIALVGLGFACELLRFLLDCIIGHRNDAGIADTIVQCVCSTVRALAIVFVLYAVGFVCVTASQTYVNNPSKFECEIMPVFRTQLYPAAVDLDGEWAWSNKDDLSVLVEAAELDETQTALMDTLDSELHVSADRVRMTVGFGDMQVTAWEGTRPEFEVGATDFDFVSDGTGKFEGQQRTFHYADGKLNVVSDSGSLAVYKRMNSDSNE